MLKEVWPPSTKAAEGRANTRMGGVNKGWDGRIPIGVH